MLSTVDMVVQRRDGPRRLRDHDDDDVDDVKVGVMASCRSGVLATSLSRMSLISFVLNADSGR